MGVGRISCRGCDLTSFPELGKIVQTVGLISLFSLSVDEFKWAVGVKLHIRCLYSTLFSVFFRWPLRSRSGVRHGRRSAQLVRHPVVGADRSSACDAAGPLHVLVQPLLCLHLPVRGCSNRQDDPHPHPCQEPLLRGESCLLFYFLFFFCLPSFGNNFLSADMCAHAEF